MTAFLLETETWLPRPLDEVFAFYADAANLETMTPPSLRFRILTPRPIEMKDGTLIDYELRLRGFPFRWQSEISLWEPPARFVDEQRKGPYRRWVHLHQFAAERDGTLVSDRVEYAVPGGALANRLFVMPELRRIFAFRHRTLHAVFNVPLAGAAPPVKFSTLQARS